MRDHALFCLSTLAHHSTLIALFPCKVHACYPNVCEDGKSFFDTMAVCVCKCTVDNVTLQNFSNGVNIFNSINFCNHN